MKRRAPVLAAMQRRRDMQHSVDAEAAVRRLQAEWRSRRMRLWCQRADRAARRLQRWLRRRWLRDRLERQVPIEAERLKALRKRLANAPPVPPSQWPQKRSAAPTGSPDGVSDAQSCHAPRGTSALLACPPPMKKPCRPCSQGTSEPQCLQGSTTGHQSSSAQNGSEAWATGRMGRNLSSSSHVHVVNRAYSKTAGYAYPPSKKAFKSSLGGVLPKLGGSSNEVLAATPRVLPSPRRKHDAMI